MKKRAYLCGNVSGIERSKVLQAFAEAERIISSLGYDVVNPVRIVPQDVGSWEKAMRICIAALMECDVMFCLPESNSKGCLIEQSLCESLGIPVYKFTY